MNNNPPAKPAPLHECLGCKTFQRKPGFQMLPQGYRCRACVVRRLNS